MSEQPLSLTIRGARGSTPIPGVGVLRYGGHTTCLSLALSPGRYLLLDCGSGLRTLRHELSGPQGLKFDVFLTHLHADHLEGLRLFPPLFECVCTFLTSLFERLFLFRGKSIGYSRPEALCANGFPDTFHLVVGERASRFIEGADDRLYTRHAVRHHRLPVPGNSIG